MHSLPTRIDPDLLKDSIVEIRFNSDLDFALVPGLVYNHLVESNYTYTGAISNPVPQAPNQLIFNVAQPTYLNDKITCRLVGNSLVFNCKGKYIGWKDYFLEIQNFLKIFDKAGVVSSYSRIGLRFINILKNENIYEKLIDDLRINLKSFSNVSTNIKTEIVDKKFKIIINLGNDFRQQDERVSVLDIDVFFEKQLDNLEFLVETLQEIHNKEKEIFFGFLKEDFVKTLKPQYDA